MNPCRVVKTVGTEVLFVEKLLIADSIFLIVVRLFTNVFFSEFVFPSELPVFGINIFIRVFSF